MMKIKDILNLASTATSVVNPLVGAGIAVINSFIKDNNIKEEPLESNSTVENIKEFIEKLSPDISNVLKDKEITLDDNFTKRYEALCKADSQETRAKIILSISKCLINVTYSFLVLIFMAVYLEPDILKTWGLWGLYPFLTGNLTIAVLAYFGVLRKEQGQRLGVIDKNSFLTRLFK